MAEQRKQQASVCVFCSSSNQVDAVYLEDARVCGRLLAESGFRLIYGGTRIGLMGAVARSAREHGAVVKGIVPEHIRLHVADCEDAEALVVTPDMRQRKLLMEQEADGFLVLPGGFGTLEEALEVLTLKQLGQHQKPIVFLNTNGFWEPLRALFAELYRQRFARREYEGLYRFAATPEEALEMVKAGMAGADAIAVTKWT